jgi:lipoate---protein ligase
LSEYINIHDNLSIEEYFYKNSEEDFLFIYRNDKSVVIGRNQSLYCEIDAIFCEENGVNIARRISGGGAVFHDLGNLNFSLIGKKDLPRLNRLLNEVLNSLGIDSITDDYNSIWLEDKKISGYAKASSSSREIQHSTLLYDCNLSEMKNALESRFKNCNGFVVSSNKVNVGNVKSLKNITLDTVSFIYLILAKVTTELGGEIVKLPNVNQEVFNSIKNYRTSCSWLYKSTSRFSFFSTKIQNNVTVEVKDGLILSLELNKCHKSKYEIESCYLGKSLYNIL